MLLLQPEATGLNNSATSCPQQAHARTHTHSCTGVTKTLKLHVDVDVDASEGSGTLKETKNDARLFYMLTFNGGNHHDQ